MLTREHGIAHYDFQKGLIIPDRLTTARHAQYLHFAGQCLTIYRQGIGQTRRDLHRAVRDVFVNVPDCPQRRVDSFCKLLDDVSTYRKQGEVKAAQLRRKVFRAAAQHHPLVQIADRLFNSDEQAFKQELAQQLGRTWAEIDEDLFADVLEFNRLESFEGYDEARQLLSRYNVAQVQVALYSALSMDVWAGRDFETILRYARLAKLMHTIEPLPGGRYHLRLDGPASVLRQTRRYGVALSAFLPALLACADWRMHAVVETRRRNWKLRLDLTSQDGLTSHLPAPEEFDSGVEADFAEKWQREPREGWTMRREGAILISGQKTFVPDFVFEHSSGLRVLMEIVGFWTPEYLEARRHTLDTFRDTLILIAIGQAADRTPIQFDWPDERVIRFKTVIKVNEVLEKLNAYVAVKG